MKEIHIPVHQFWQPEWSKSGEWYATEMAKRSSAKTFPRFHTYMVNALGACTEQEAAFLWNQLHPDKPRKYTLAFQDELTLPN